MMESQMQDNWEIKGKTASVSKGGDKVEACTKMRLWRTLWNMVKKLDFILKSILCGLTGYIYTFKKMMTLK